MERLIVNRRNWVFEPWNKIIKKHTGFRINCSTLQTHSIGNWYKIGFRKKRSTRHSISRYILRLAIDTRTHIQCSQTRHNGSHSTLNQRTIHSMIWAWNVEDNKKVGNRVAEEAGLRLILFNIMCFHNTSIPSKKTSKLFYSKTMLPAETKVTIQQAFNKIYNLVGNGS